MTIMKKKYKIIIALAATAFVLIATCIIIVSIKRSEKIAFIMMEKHYSLLYEEKPELDLSLYASKQDNYYLDSAHIDKVFLYNDSDSYLTKVLSLTSENDTITFKDKDYYKNTLSLKLDIETNNPINISNAKVKIIYQNDYLLDLNVGNIAFQKASNNDDIQIQKVQSIVTTLDQGTTLAAVLLKLKVNDNVSIVNTNLISSSLRVNNDYCLVKEGNYEVENNVDLKVLFGDSYAITNQPTKGFQQVTLNNEEKVIIIPLSYQNIEFVDNCGIVISYTLDGLEKTMIVNPYVLFRTMDNNSFIYEYKPIKN